MVPRIQDPPARPPPNARLLSVQSIDIASKANSLRSHSSSFEADDERSDTTDDDIDPMSPRGSLEIGSPPDRYYGEDTRPTSKKELAGWYMYGFAAETYVICGKPAV
jgi:MFS transporter, UMF1 family